MFLSATCSLISFSLAFTSFIKCVHRRAGLLPVLLDDAQCERHAHLHHLSVRRDVLPQRDHDGGEEAVHHAGDRDAE